jgi:DNA polymerase-3 subunit beta
MQIRVDRDTFVDALGPVQSVVEAKKTIPILSHVLLEGGPKGLSLFGTDLDVGIQRRIHADISEPGAIALAAKKLYEIARELPDAPIEITTDPEMQVSISCQRSSFRMKGLPRDEFPSLPAGAGASEVVFEPALFRDILRKTLFAVSSDQTRYALTGVLLQVQAAEITMVATDGHRLALVKLPRPESTGVATLDALVPRKAMGEAVKAARDEAGPLRLHLAESQLIVHQENTTLAARLIDGQFPNYDQVVPPVSENRVQIAKEALHGAIRRTSAIMGERAAPTEFDIQAGRVIISCVNMDLGEAHEEVEVAYGGDSMKVGFNARYILDFLGAVDTEQVSIQITDPLSPTVFRAVGDEHYSCVIMPMRI